MIKKIFVPVIILLISLLIFINYLAYKSPTEEKIITQQHAYSLTNDVNMHVLLYANKKTSFQEVELIENTYLCNKEETKKLDVELLSIKESGKYSYLKENYKEYSYVFKLPEVNSYFYIEDAYLFIRLKNGHEKQFKIGSFDCYQKEESLNVVELYGKRYDNFPTLENISFRFSLEEDVFIEHVYLSNGIFTYVGKNIKDNELLTIDFPKLDKITNHLTVKIEYQLNGLTKTATLPYFVFYETIENPLNYGVLNNVYLLD